ncbi:hypothetical protein FJW08_31990 [Mesorhizobium sp. B3-2-1]|nr:hypothetical protein FJW08_31990 [Mesorhizobium sp. B3-2-1]
MPTTTETNDDEWRRCDECRSKYRASSSKMAYLCPECSHLVYGYENCPHEFDGSRCKICGWNDRRSRYIRSLLSDR